MSSRTFRAIDTRFVSYQIPELITFRDTDFINTFERTSQVNLQYQNNTTSEGSNRAPELILCNIKGTFVVGAKSTMCCCSHYSKLIWSYVMP